MDDAVDLRRVDHGAIGGRPRWSGHNMRQRDGGQASGEQPLERSASEGSDPAHRRNRLYSTPSGTRLESGEMSEATPEGPKGPRTTFGLTAASRLSARQEPRHACEPRTREAIATDVGRWKTATEQHRQTPARGST